MKTNFWQKLNKPFTVLAPMANVTDWAFRQIIIECGRPDVFFTEFISCDGICAVGHEKFKGELYFEENERPIVAQFFTARPENAYRCAELAQELGFDGIDINMGCPDRSVEKQGAGAALIKNPELAREIIRKTKAGAGGLPISIKTRLGFNKIEPDWIDALLDTEISALTIHLRTRKEMSKIPAHWEEAEKISEKARENGKIIIGNGDVKNIRDACAKAENYGLDGIMAGRGIFDNPWFFAGKEAAEAGPRINLLIRHLENFEKLWGGNKKFDYMRKFFKIYISGWPGSKELRKELMSAKNKNEAVDYLKHFS